MRERVVAELGGEAGEAIRAGTLIASGWFPAAWYAALLEQIVHVTEGDVQTVRRISREAVKSDFRTLFRLIRLFLRPEMTLQQSVRVSRRYIDGGEIDVIEARDGFIHYQFSDFQGYTRLMWWDFIGGIEGVLENAGAEAIVADLRSGGGDGSARMELVLRWRRAR